MIFLIGFWPISPTVDHNPRTAKIRQCDFNALFNSVLGLEFHNLCSDFIFTCKHFALPLNLERFDKPFPSHKILCKCFVCNWYHFVGYYDRKSFIKSTNIFIKSRQEYSADFVGINFRNRSIPSNRVDHSYGYGSKWCSIGLYTNLTLIAIICWNSCPFFDSNISNQSLN